MADDSILEIIFYGLIGIVIFAIVRNVCPETLWMPLFVLIAAILWMVYDYVVQERNKLIQPPYVEIDTEPVEAELEEPNCDFGTDWEELTETPEQLNHRWLQNYRENRMPNKFNSYQPMIEGHVNDDSNRCIAQHNNEFDIDIAKGEPIQAIFQRSGSSADNAIANRMKYMAMQPKLSMEIRARHNRYTMQPYFEEELSANEKRDWWDTENDWMDAFM